jgi:hypothetical protein
VTFIVNDTISDDASENSPAVSSVASRPAQPEPQPQPLGALLRLTAEAPGDIPPVLTAQVVTSNGQDIILIGHSVGAGIGVGGSVGAVEVLTDTGVLTRRSAGATATPVTDPARRERVLRLTLSRLAGRYREELETRRRETERQADLLAGIRDYAVEWYETGDIGREALTDFLSEFDLSPYRQRVRVTYTITGSYVVDDSTPDEARQDAEGYLRPALSSLDRVVEDSDSYTVSLDDIDDAD